MGHCETSRRSLTALVSSCLLERDQSPQFTPSPSSAVTAPPLSRVLATRNQPHSCRHSLAFLAFTQNIVVHVKTLEKLSINSFQSCFLFKHNNVLATSNHPFMKTFLLLDYWITLHTEDRGSCENFRICHQASADLLPRGA